MSAAVERAPPRSDDSPALRRRDVRAEGGQRPLGVIPGRLRLGHRPSRRPHGGRRAARRSSPGRSAPAWRTSIAAQPAAPHRRRAGSRPSVSMRAPMRSSGSVTRRIGLRLSEASPVSVARERVPGQHPHQQAGRACRSCRHPAAPPGAVRPPRPRPSTSHTGPSAPGRALDAHAERREAGAAWSGSRRRARAREWSCRPSRGRPA